MKVLLPLLGLITAALVPVAHADYPYPQYPYLRRNHFEESRRNHEKYSYSKRMEARGQQQREDSARRNEYESRSDESLVGVKPGSANGESKGYDDRYDYREGEYRD